LGALGFATFSNSEGIYPGDPRYAPIWEAINQTNKTMFIHPATPYLNIPCAGFVVANPLANVTVVSNIEFFADTARAFSDLFFRDIVRNYTK
jgi:predicted TIM-barrel fold metal-dependent hydrolase